MNIKIMLIVNCILCKLGYLFSCVEKGRPSMRVGSCIRVFRNLGFIDACLFRRR
jgi:hypothetical protein